MVTWIGNKFAASIDLEVVGNGWNAAVVVGLRV
jgi:hypothetical protein